MSASIHDSPLPVTNHRLDIQGLRAVAVIAVILYHADDLLPGGFVGVDVFFVISGFVIMRSLAREHARTSAINLADFYRRRIRRLTPVLALTIIVVVPLSILLGPISSVDFGARTGVAATFLSANMYLARNGGYFATAAELNPLNHTWSLSLEEQFYLVFPAVVSFLYWRSTRGQQVHRGIALGLLCLSLVSLGLALFMSYGPGLGPIEASTLRHYSFFVMPARAWQFGAGALLAILLASDDYRFAKPGHGAVGGALVVACFLAFNDGLNYPGAWALVPTVGSVLLLANPKSVFLGFLEHPAIVKMGDVSYSWYLWHWPAMVFARAAGLESQILLAAVGFGVLPLAMFTYARVETKYRKPAKSQRRGGWLPITATSVIVSVVALGSVALASAALPDGIDRGSSQDLHLYLTCETERITDDLEACQFAGQGPHVVLLGDSNAGHFSESVVGAANNQGWQSTVIAQGACPMLDLEIVDSGEVNTKCALRWQAARDWYLSTSPDLVIYAAAPEIYLGLDQRFEISRGPLRGLDAYTAALHAFHDELASAGIKLVIVQPIPKFSLGGGFTGWKSSSALKLILDSESAGLLMPRQEALDRRQIAVDINSLIPAATLDLFDAVCPGDTCTERRDDVWLYLDPQHISVAFAIQLIPEFEALLIDS